MRTTLLGLRACGDCTVYATVARSASHTLTLSSGTWKPLSVIRIGRYFTTVCKSLRLCNQVSFNIFSAACNPRSFISRTRIVGTASSYTSLAKQVFFFFFLLDIISQEKFARVRRTPEIALHFQTNASNCTNLLPVVYTTAKSFLVRKRKLHSRGPLVCDRESFSEADSQQRMLQCRVLHTSASWAFGPCTKRKQLDANAYSVIIW